MYLMQILTITNCLLADSLPLLAAPAVSLTFNPIKLAVLVAWVYLCIYCVQRTQFSILVPKKYKSAANVAALFVGPILLLVLIALDTIRKSSESHRSIFEIIKTHLPTNQSVDLFDTAGLSIRSIYGSSKNKQQDNQILNLTEQIIAKAIEQRASDILIDPRSESIYTLRFRVDGVLREVDQIETDTCKAVVNSIKAVSRMDIAEKRRPQDGSFIAKAGDYTASFRVASAGVLNGEKLSIRVLNKNASWFTLNNIGLSKKQQVIVKSTMAKQSGMVLICGPIGSGKTTTLYAMMNNIDLFTRNVVTVEDPIECLMPNVSQIEVNPKAGITFANSLRSILRQDPDVICVGEIRDSETAEITLQAAQTGQLVLATMHSNSTASALIRLLDLGASPLSLSTGLDLIISQRLIRQLCHYCKTPAELSESQIEDFRKRKVNYRNIFEPQGCEKCHETGYYGMSVIFDILTLDAQLKANIVNNELPINQLRKEGDKRGKSNLQKQGLKKVVSGITSIKELSRVVG